MRPLWHGLRILFTVLRFRLDTILLELAQDHWIRWFLLSRYLPTPRSATAVRLRLAIEHLGPVFIKVGQILSTRRDLLPVDYADELAKLQDRVPPFATPEAINLIEAALEKKLDIVFQNFDSTPIASASLAQVYGAELHDESPVVIKVIRPGVDVQIRRDLELIFQTARFLMQISADARRLRLVEVVQDFENTLFDELDLTKEASNTSRLRYNFTNSDLLYTPRVYDQYTTADVLVMERVFGVPISAHDELVQKGTDFKKLAIRGVETFFTQVFKHNYFHADMHPGNIFIDVSDPADPSYIAIDCAIMGELTNEDQTYLARNIVAFFNQDFEEIANLHAESGWIGASSNTEEFEQVIRDLCEPLFKQPLSQISFGHFLLDLFSTARRFNMVVQPQLVLLQKTLLNIEGLGRQLDPDLDLWSTAKPFMEEWMQERYGVAATIKAFSDNLPALITDLPKLPSLLLTADKRMGQIERRLRVHSHAIEDLQTKPSKSGRTKLTALRWVLSAIFLLTGVFLLGLIIQEFAFVGSQEVGYVVGSILCVFSYLLKPSRQQ